MIQELLYTGANQALTLDQLRERTHLTEAEIIKQIEREREDGAIILETLTGKTRYYLPLCSRDLFKTIWEIDSIIKTLQSQLYYYRNLKEQIREAIIPGRQKGNND